MLTFTVFNTVVSVDDSDGHNGDYDGDYDDFDSLGDDDHEGHDGYDDEDSLLIAHDLDTVVGAEADGRCASFDGVVVLHKHHHRHDGGGGDDHTAQHHDHLHHGEDRNDNLVMNDYNDDDKQVYL